MGFEDGAARHLHLVVAEQRPPDLVRVVGRRAPFRSRRRSLGRRSRRRRGSAPHGCTILSRGGGGGAGIDEEPHLVGGRSGDERDTGRRTSGEGLGGRAPDSTSPSTIGWNGIIPTVPKQRSPCAADCASTSASTGRSRRPARSATPARVDEALETTSARASSSVADVAPLCMIAPATRPAAEGDAQRVQHSPPPADSPNATTRAGSPPNDGDVVVHPPSAHKASRTPQLATPPKRPCVEKAERAPSR